MIPSTLAAPRSHPPPILAVAHFTRLLVSISSPKIRGFKPSRSNIYRSGPCKCSASVASGPAQIEMPEIQKPFPAEVSRTIVELASGGTLSMLNHDGFPLGFGVRFAIDSNGTPILCLNESQKSLADNNKCSLHVQLEQGGMRTLHCTILGTLEKPCEVMALRKLNSAWNKRFNELLDESFIHIINVEQVIQTEDYAENAVWIGLKDYASAEPDPLRDCAVKIVDQINALHSEDIQRFCSVFVDLDFQFLDAKMVWIDRLGFDVHVRSVHNHVYGVRIPFPGEVTNEKGAKSSFNGMCQLAWEVEKNLCFPDFKKVKHFKKIMGTMA